MNRSRLIYTVLAIQTVAIVALAVLVMDLRASVASLRFASQRQADRVSEIANRIDHQQEELFAPAPSSNFKPDYSQ